jgi:7-cyano-7-deazaguanine synthase in queuosine biosynthesis
MRLRCAPAFDGPRSGDDLPVLLYGQPEDAEFGSAGASLAHEIQRQKLMPAPRAWDFLSLAISAVAADFAVHRNQGPDGWTRDLDIDVAVADAAFWSGQVVAVEQALSFLTTDRWSVRFSPDGFAPARPKKRARPECDGVVLLSGGLDSLVGAIDLHSQGKNLMAVSHRVRGDVDNQAAFARQIGQGLMHLSLNHAISVPDPENSQRARSMAFLAYGVLAATTLAAYEAGQTVPLFVCENGFISINPPLTRGRVGSLSTRTTHPAFLRRIQTILDAAGLRVRIETPYQLTTKGEMLVKCAGQALLKKLAPESTSCGRYLRYGYRHCGRCVPCQVRRAAFLKWGKKDRTEYVFEDLGKNDEGHAGFDDVRAVAAAIVEVKRSKLERWLAGTLNSSVLGDVTDLKSMVGRGLAELAKLHKHYRVK